MSKGRYTITKLLKDCLFPNGLYRIRDKKTGWKIIIEDKNDASKLKNYLENQSQQIHDLQEQLKNAIPKFEIGDGVYSLRNINKVGYGMITQIYHNKEGVVEYWQDNYFIGTNEDTFATQAEAEQRLSELRSE